MITFSYTIRDQLGIHARPAGIVAKMAQSYPCEITVECKGKTASLKRLLAVMGMGIKAGDRIRVYADGDTDISALRDFFMQNL